MDGFLNAQVERILGAPLPDRLSGNSSCRFNQGTEEFIQRTLSLMAASSFPVRDCSPFMIRQLVSIVPNYLPSSWNGKIPPLTAAKRHQKIDAYIAALQLETEAEHPVFIDIGCAIPPVTTVDTAEKLPGWNVLGVDSAFADYVLYDSEGNYGCFDPAGNLLYLQTAMRRSSCRLNDNPEMARLEFKELFQRLKKELRDTACERSTSIEQEGNRLIHNHIYDFESSNLRFMQCDLSELKMVPVQAVRCMNVLLYHSPEVRRRMLNSIADLLDVGGCAVIGTNNLQGRSCRYTVYRKASGTLVPIEFSFGLDNLRPFDVLPWFTLQKDDPEAEALAELTGTARADQNFWPRFNTRVDALFKEERIYSRAEDDFLAPLELGMQASPVEIFQRVESIWCKLSEEGYPAQVVDVLNQAGYRCRLNHVGDIAVSPAEGLLQTYM